MSKNIIFVLNLQLKEWKWATNETLTRETHAKVVFREKFKVEGGVNENKTNGQR
jgi:hypothetical protein